MEYRVGDVICYRAFGGGVRRVLVEERFADVKHGRPGFAGTVVSGPERGAPVWGYDHQIVPLRLLANEGRAGRALRSAAGVSRAPAGPVGPPPRPGRRAG